MNIKYDISKIWKTKLSQKLLSFEQGAQNKKKHEKFVAIENSIESDFKIDTDDNNEELKVEKVDGSEKN